MARSMVYRFDRWTAVTPSDVADSTNIEGAWSFMVSVAGDVQIRHRDATTVVIPCLAGTAYEIGYEMVNIDASNTTATGIFKAA